VFAAGKNEQIGNRPLQLVMIIGCRICRNALVTPDR
jgi:hypothetical protein